VEQEAETVEKKRGRGSKRKAATHYNNVRISMSVLLCWYNVIVVFTLYFLLFEINFVVLWMYEL
jgi:hypothetical protein